MSATINEKHLYDSISKLKELDIYIKENSNKVEAHEMEQSIFHKCLEIGKGMLNLYFEQLESKGMGKEIQYWDIEFKRNNELTTNYHSIFGEIQIKRVSYWRKGYPVLYPLDKQSNLPEKSFSYFLRDIVNNLCMTDSFSESKMRLKRFFNLTIHEQQLEQMTQDSSRDYEQFYEQKPAPAADTEGEIQVISYDGKGVPMIKKEAAKIIAKQGKGEKRQKKKEALVGISYTVDKNVRTAKEVADNLIYPENRAISKVKEGAPNTKAVNIRRMASVAKPKEEVIAEIIKDSMKRNPGNKKDVVVLIDGAQSLWKKIVAQLLNKIKNYIVILDIIHVLEYVYLAGNVLHEENSKELKVYVYKQLISILNGDIGRVIGGLKQTVTKQKLKGTKLKTMKKVITYFTNHIPLMKYDQYLAKGYPIATGVVESACKLLVKDRMEGCGMRWSIKGAEAMLLLRSIEKSSDWEDYQNFHIKQEGRRLYDYENLKRIELHNKAA